MAKPRIDNKVITIIVLVVLGIFLTSIKEKQKLSYNIQSLSEEHKEYDKDKVLKVVESSLYSVGIEKRSIRRRTRTISENTMEEFLVTTSPQFDVLKLLIMLQHSLYPYSVDVMATENLKQKVSTIKIIKQHHVLQNIIIQQKK